MASESNGIDLLQLTGWDRFNPAETSHQMDFPNIQPKEVKVGEIGIRGCGGMDLQEAFSGLVSLVSWDLCGIAGDRHSCAGHWIA
jgi:hypothetical protein